MEVVVAVCNLAAAQAAHSKRALKASQAGKGRATWPTRLNRRARQFIRQTSGRRLAQRSPPLPHTLANDYDDPKPTTRYDT